jgi:hypothetical protein
MHKTLIHRSAWKVNSQKFARGKCGWHHAVSERGSSEEDTI